MQTKAVQKSVVQTDPHPLFLTLHNRIHELPENFKDFVQSECNWTPGWYDVYLQHPEKCPPENLLVIIKIAGDLAYDLQVLTTRCKQTLLEHKAGNHEIQ